MATHPRIPLLSASTVQSVIEFAKVHKEFRSLEDAFQHYKNLNKVPGYWLNVPKFHLASGFFINGQPVYALLRFPPPLKSLTSTTVDITLVVLNTLQNKTTEKKQRRKAAHGQIQPHDSVAPISKANVFTGAHSLNCNTSPHPANHRMRPILQ